MLLNLINVEDSDSVNNRLENNNLINSKVAEEEEEQPSNTVGQSDDGEGEDN